VLPLEYHKGEVSSAYLLCNPTHLLMYGTQIEYQTSKSTSPLAATSLGLPARLTTTHISFTNCTDMTVSPTYDLFPADTRLEILNVESSRMRICCLSHARKPNKPIHHVFTAPKRPLESLTAAYQQLYAPASSIVRNICKYLTLPSMHDILLLFFRCCMMLRHIQTMYYPMTNSFTFVCTLWL
jgi:hypothetical protein